MFISCYEHFSNLSNELRRYIASGIEKMADESITAKIFCTTPKVDLRHYSCIFRKPEPLGKEMKNLVCSRLGKMLNLDTQRGKEAAKMS